MTILEVKEIERRWVKKDKTLHTDELFNVAKFYYSQIEIVSAKERSGVSKQAGFYAIEAFKSGLVGVENLELARSIVSKAMQLMSWPESFAKSLSKITLKWLDLSGNGNAEILETKKVSILIRTGLVVISDPSKCSDLSTEYDAKNFINLINQGQIFAFAIGGDGKINLEIRLIKSVEPVLLAKEYSKLSNSTPVLNFKTTQGDIVIGDFYGADKDFKNIKFSDVECLFKVGAFSMKSGKYIIVFCKTDQSNNNISDIPDLEQ